MCHDEIFKDLIQTVGLPLLVFTVCSGDLKKKEKKSSENDRFIS